MDWRPFENLRNIEDLKSIEDPINTYYLFSDFWRSPIYRKYISELYIVILLKEIYWRSWLYGETFWRSSLHRRLFEGFFYRITFEVFCFWKTFGSSPILYESLDENSLQIGLLGSLMRWRPFEDLRNIKDLTSIEDPLNIVYLLSDFWRSSIPRRYGETFWRSCLHGSFFEDIFFQNNFWSFLFLEDYWKLSYSI